MGYISTSRFGEFSCGPHCGCTECRRGTPSLAEVYEEDIEPEPPQAVPRKQSRSSPNPLANTAYGEPPPRPRVCDNRNIPTSEVVRPLTATKVACTRPSAFGVADPFDVISKAVNRAVEMLDNTIYELVNGRNAVCNGAPPAWPLFGDITLEWLRDRLGVCINDIRMWTAGTFVIGSVAEVIRRLLRIRNLIASNGIRYVCGGRCNPADPASGCVAGDWAFACIPQICPAGAVPAIVHLCRNFWIANPGVDPKDHAEFQAQTIIHEVSHLYYCTADVRGSGLGVAECLAQFVAATNGSPLDPLFIRRCAVTNRCAGTGAGGLGLATPGDLRIVRTSFRPQDAIRLKGRLAQTTGKKSHVYLGS